MVCKCMLACKNGCCITHLNFLSITSVRIHIMFMIMVDFYKSLMLLHHRRVRCAGNCSSIAKY